MAKWINKPGRFRGRALEWNVKKLHTGSVAISILFEVSEVYESEDWQAMQIAMTVRGDFFVISKKGDTVEKVAELLCLQMGWGGLFSQVENGPPTSRQVQIDVEGREHNGKTYYEARWIHDADADPGARGGALTAEAVHDLDKRHGKALQKFAAQFQEKPADGDVADIPF